MDKTNRQMTKIAREVNKLLIQQMKKEGTGTGEIEMIHYIRHHEGCSLKEVADALGIDKAAVTRRATVLEKKGFIERRANPKDGRSSLLFALKEAEDLKNLKSDIESEFYQWLLEELDEKERNTFCETLNKLYLRSKIESRSGFVHIKERLGE